MIRNLFGMVLVVCLIGACTPMFESRKVCIPTKGIKQTKIDSKPVRLFMDLLKLAHSARVEAKRQALLKKINWCFEYYKTSVETKGEALIRKRNERDQIISVADWVWVYKKFGCKRFSKLDDKEFKKILWLRRTIDFVESFKKVCLEKSDGSYSMKGWWASGEDRKSKRKYILGTRLSYSIRMVPVSVLRTYPIWSKILNNS